MQTNGLGVQADHPLAISLYTRTEVCNGGLIQDTHQRRAHLVFDFYGVTHDNSYHVAGIL